MFNKGKKYTKNRGIECREPIRIYKKCNCYAFNHNSSLCEKIWIKAQHPFKYDSVYVGVCREYLIRNAVDKHLFGKGYFDLKHFVINEKHRIMLEAIEHEYSIDISMFDFRYFYKINRSKDLFDEKIHVFFSQKPFLSGRISIKDLIDICLKNEYHNYLRSEVMPIILKYFSNENMPKKYKTLYSEIGRKARAIKNKGYVGQYINIDMIDLLTSILEFNYKTK